MIVKILIAVLQANPTSSSGRNVYIQIEDKYYEITHVDPDSSNDIIIQAQEII